MNDYNTKPRFTKRDIFLIIFKRKRTFVTIFFLTTLFVTIGTYVVTPPYETTAKLYVARGESPTIPALIQASSRFLEREDVLVSEIEIMKSRTVAERVTDVLSLHKVEAPPSFVSKFFKMLKSPLFILGLFYEVSPREAAIMSLRKKVKIKAIPKSDILQVSYKGQNPEKISKVVNTMIETYLERRLELLKSMGAESFYSEQAAIFKKRIDDLNIEMQGLKAKLSIGQINKEREAMQKQLADLNMELMNSEQEFVGIEAKLKDMKKNSRFVAFDESKGNYQIVEVMISRMLELDMKKNKFEQELKKNNPAIIKLEVEITQLRQRILDAVESIKDELHFRIEKYKAQIELIETRKLALNEGEDHIKEVTSAIDFAEDSYARYQKLKEDARLAAMGKANMVNVRVVDYAIVPSNPIFPRITFIFLGAFLSIISAFGIVLLLAYFDHTIDSADDVAHFTNLQVFAVLPEVEE
jgi:uncharacterized protein involved in exopolysaccharide biosynthesis